MKKITCRVSMILALLILSIGFNSCIITDLTGGLLFEWDDDDLAGSGNSTRDVIINNYTGSQVYVAIDVTLDDRNQPNWRDPLWEDHLSGNEEAVLNLSSATNKYVWIYAETENNVEKRTGQGSHFFENDDTEVLYISVFREKAN